MGRGVDFMKRGRCGEGRGGECNDEENLQWCEVSSTAMVRKTSNGDVKSHIL